MSGVTQLVRVAAQVPTDLAEQLAVLAKANERSVAAELRLAIRAHVEQAEEAA